MLGEEPIVTLTWMALRDHQLGDNSAARDTLNKPCNIFMTRMDPNHIISRCNITLACSMYWVVRWRVLEQWEKAIDALPASTVSPL